MEPASAALYIVVCRGNLGILLKAVFPAGYVDLHEVLIYYAACAEVHMSHLGIAHLAVGKTYIFAAGLKV